MATARVTPLVTALVTGASRGIGRELALLLGREGYHVVLTGRDRAALDEVARSVEGPGSATVVTGDLAAPAGASELCAELARRGLETDVLVNNAGTGSFGPFHAADPDRLSAIAAVNVHALTLLTRLLLPPMIGRRFGRVLNVASAASFYPGPFMAAYYASKAYVLSLSEALARELAGTGVTVTAVCPGPTDSDFQSRAGLTSADYAKRTRLSSPVRVAEAAYRAMLRGKRLVVYPPSYRLMVSLSRLLPRGVALRAVERTLRRR